MVEIHKINWQGSFSFPSFEQYNKLPSAPSYLGVYLLTVDYNDGFLIYSVGMTTISIYKRLQQHKRCYLKGDYNILDIKMMQQGIRKSLWQGWGWSDEKLIKWNQNKENLENLAREQLKGFRVFTAGIDLDKRRLQRLEAKIMNSLYRAEHPFSDLPDKSMNLLPKRDDEEPILIQNICDKAIFGLPISFFI